MMALIGRIAARQDLVLVSIIIMTVLMMVLPVPTLMADALIATDIGIALLLMLMAVYVHSPTDFSTLPSLILVTTAFRLSISITTSRLVLVQGDAGSIIRTFGEFVISGNVVVGLVVYLIITVVQFVVITKGAERVAEVAARFTLDALPGKQSSIDTDVRNGDLTPTEARRRRRHLERESQLYGAMDGAMKFVKGDAIASLIIIAVNLVGGMAIGCLQRGLPLSRAVQNYSLLAVGDGLIAQIPALLVSLTAGLVVTRAVAEDGGNLGEHIMGQIMANTRPLQLGGCVIAGLGMVPGFPTLLFAGLGLAMIGASLLAGRLNRRRSAEDFATSVMVADAAPEPAKILLRIGPGISSVKTELEPTLAGVQEELSASLGIRIPRFRVSVDERMEPHRLDILIDDVARANISISDASAVPAEVRRVIARCAPEFVGIQEVQGLIGRFESNYGDLVGEALKVAPIPRMAEILRLLIAEQVSIANLRTVLEGIADAARREQPPAEIADRVRMALRRQICAQWAGPANRLSALVLDGVLETMIRTQAALKASNPLITLAQPLQTLAEEAARLRVAHRAANPSIEELVLIVAPDIRRFVQHLVSTQCDEDIPVLSHAEIAAEFHVIIVAPVMAGLEPGTAAVAAEGSQTVRHLQAAA